MEIDTFLELFKEKEFVDLEDFEDKETLNRAIEDGLVVRTKKNKYCLPKAKGYITGTYMGTAKDYGFVVPEDGSGDIFIENENSLGAFNKDRVFVVIIDDDDSSKPEGEVVKIVKRNTDTFVGTVVEEDRKFFVVPDDKKIPYYIECQTFRGSKSAKKGLSAKRDKFDFANSSDFFDETLKSIVPDLKVVIKVTVWPKPGKDPRGVIIKVLGSVLEPETEIKAVIYRHKLKAEFDAAVLNEANNIKAVINEDDIKGRLDCRALTVITIDDETAKDLDDAVSIELLENGNYYLGVHIADVTHYVKEGSAIDLEAFFRGTSVYFADRVLPMLPSVLSNGICSLNPNIDRFTLSVFMEIDYNGKVVDYKIRESVIKTVRRMTYSEVYNILSSSGEVADEYKTLEPVIRRMQELALILKHKRSNRGEIDLSIPEAKIIFDDSGNVIDVKKREITIAHKIIEEFMIVCNETVAEHIHWLEIPFVYRVHENPDIEKTEKLSKLLLNRGYKIKIDPNSTVGFRRLLESVKGTPDEKIFPIIILRAMAKARYSENNIGHFGLASKFYCHFTSPIRRYPDLIIHRIIKEHMNLSPKRIEYLKEKVREVSIQSSKQELAAKEAEREIERFKKAQFMQDKTGLEFEGFISGLTSFGMFVELDNTVEGLVKFRDLEGYYIYDYDNYFVTKENSERTFTLGDRVRVVVESVDIIMKEINFSLIEF